ncbi:MAG: type IV pilus twitching motility protein PilT [Ruminococcaceae bacterium]|nr:type IV pilus twitching motility protein PilT [Oscillospiraceae bacterium]
MAKIMSELLRDSIERRGSDIHITVNRPVQIRVDGEIFDLDDEVLTSENVDSLADEILDERTKNIFIEEGEADFAYSFGDIARLRCNVYRESGRTAIALRVLPYAVPSTSFCNTPEVVIDAVHARQGLVLVTGPTGHGKSTTLAALINDLNNTEKKHIITLEDPVEYLHQQKMCTIHQREIGIDSKSFSTGLRAALRQDPDVILVGEMRDIETISIAITAAETGHLVLATLHTNSASMTIDRIIDAFPAEQQDQIRIQLSNVLNCVVCQCLVPTVEGRRTAAYEVLVPTTAVRNLIRENKTFQINSMIQMGHRFGMQTLDDHLYELCKKKTITYETAMAFANDAKALENKMNGL